MAKQKLQAKKAYFSMLTKVKKHNLEADVFIDLVEKLVIPSLWYGQKYGVSVTSNNYKFF